MEGGGGLITVLYGNTGTVKILIITITGSEYIVLLANLDIKFSSSLYVKVTILKVKGCNKEAAHSNTTDLQVFSMVKEMNILYFIL